MSEPAPATVRTLYDKAEVSVHPVSYAGDDLGGLSKAIFKDQKWENALQYLRSNDLATRDAVQEIVLDGARVFGMWRLSEPSLQALVAQVMETPRVGPSSGLQSWVRHCREAAQFNASDENQTASCTRQLKMLTMRGQSHSTPPPCEVDQSFRTQPLKRVPSARRSEVFEEWVGLLDAITLRRVKWGLALFLTAMSCTYASWVVFVKYDGILKVFTWPILLARAGGMGTAIITGLMYLTMARTFMKQFYSVFSFNSKVLMILDGHKDIHIFLGRCLMVTSAVHVLAHLLSTVPSMHYGSTDELNSIIACAERDEKMNGWPSLSWLQWPACPLTTGSDGWSVLFQSTPGVSGLALVVLLLLLGRTGRARSRSENFERFWYVHNFALVAWPMAMFVHGSNQWIGVGFPLVTFTACVPICLYSVDRVSRLLRYYLFGGKSVRIVNAVIRPGNGGSSAGALTHLTISEPPGLWTFAPGMFAYINMPEYASMQWHPFTICSGKNDEHVEFIIAGVGDWTRELAARCLRAQSSNDPLPTVALDGPFAAPAQSALSRPILVAVGAGVGITPFLSLMSSLISLIEDGDASNTLPLKEAHFFWMTRSVDEFLFGRKHFTRIAHSPRLRQKVHLHLHTTAKEPEGDGAAYLFREAVKRQSKFDRAVFKYQFDAKKVLTAPQLPWCWVNGSDLDVMWLSGLTDSFCRPHEDSSDFGFSLSESDIDAAEAAEEGRARVAERIAERPFVSRSRSVPSLTLQAWESSSALPKARVSSRSPKRSQSPRATRSLPVRGADGPGCARICHSEQAEQPEQPRQPEQLPPPAGTNSGQAGQLLRKNSCQSRASSGWAQRLLRQNSRESRLSTRCRASQARTASHPSLESSEGPGTPTNDEEEGPLLPVVFGRPNFEMELRAIGAHWQYQEQVHIYVCGNDAIVKGLRSTADTLNTEARASTKEKRSGANRYIVTYERFG